MCIYMYEIFYNIISILEKAGLQFYVKGGIILANYLGNHARETNDIDIIIPGDSDTFIQQVKKAFSSYKGYYSFEVIDYKKEKASEKYTYNTFGIDVKVSHEDEKQFILLEGTSCELFNSIKPVSYTGKYKDNEFIYKGVPIEYTFADKILAITSDVKRPYKHLIDAYSLTQISTTNINYALLKHYLNIVSSYENKIRRGLGLEENKYEFIVKDSKKFSQSYYLTVLQAGYNLTEKETKEKINLWMKKFLKDDIKE